MFLPSKFVSSSALPSVSFNLIYNSVHFLRISVIKCNCNPFLFFGSFQAVLVPFVVSLQKNVNLISD